MSDDTIHDAPDFATFITDLANGSVNQRLTQDLAEVVRAVEATGKVGEMTVKVLVKKEGTMAVVGVDNKTKVPRHPMHGTLFHIGNNGELLRDDPRQLALRNLSEPSKKLRTVSFPMGEVQEEIDE